MFVLVEHILSVWSVLDYTSPCYKKAGSHGAFMAYCELKFPMVGSNSDTVSVSELSPLATQL